jgi:hypothetical protein
MREQDLYSHCADRECASDEQDLYSLLEANRKDDGESQRCSQSQGIVVLLLTGSDSEQTREKNREMPKIVRDTPQLDAGQGEG